jgi:ornithine cyclodeaminase/alanine dehydrogenase-like protein (mu-crystallin family)
MRDKSRTSVSSRIHSNLIGERLGKELLYLSQADVVSAGLGMAEIITTLEEMFREKGEGRVEMPPKIGIHTMPDAFIHAMPASIPAQKAAGIKWIGGFPDNSRRGLPYITGLLILNDLETGVPVALMDCTWITAQRTGAATAVAAKYLARPESSSVGILGCGVQGRSNLEALKVLFPLKKVYAYDRHLDRAERYATEMSGQLGIEVVAVSDAKPAVVASDMVVTAGPILRKPHATIQRGWLREGAFASLVDFDSYFHSSALHEADKFCTDDVSQLQHYRDLGYFQDIPAIHADLGELVTGRKVGREKPEERTMACNLGLALDDIAVAPLIYDRALEKGIGTWLPL